MLFEKKDKENISDSRKRILKDINDVQNNNVINNEYINPLASPSAGAPALNYGDVNTETTFPGEVKGLIIKSVKPPEHIPPAINIEGSNFFLFYLLI